MCLWFLTYNTPFILEMMYLLCYQRYILHRYYYIPYGSNLDSSSVLGIFALSRDFLSLLVIVIFFLYINIKHTFCIEQQFRWWWWLQPVLQWWSTELEVFQIHMIIPPFVPGLKENNISLNTVLIRMPESPLKSSRPSNQKVEENKPPLKYKLTWKPLLLI